MFLVQPSLFGIKHHELVNALEQGVDKAVAHGLAAPLCCRLDGGSTSSLEQFFFLLFLLSKFCPYRG